MAQEATVLAVMARVGIAKGATAKDKLDQVMVAADKGDLARATQPVDHDKVAATLGAMVLAKIAPTSNAASSFRENNSHGNSFRENSVPAGQLHGLVTVRLVDTPGAK